MKFRRDPKLALIRRLPLFEGCTSAEIREIGAIADEMWLPPGRRLTTEGAHGQELVVIVTGSVEVDKRGRKVATLGPGDFVGEISLLTGRPRTATVVTTSAVVVLVIARHRFAGLVDRLPGLQARLDEVVPLRMAS
ncbi:cyclic nucleotide-binding domain-containing protein [Marmoricola sp. RAF53]|uniref:cyclic nucleotide-binding domain-containing protein n=1 Tax=Marmoricola sp. RAF53 TaxID=3233059 RepID=UPI003F991F95